MNITLEKIIGYGIVGILGLSIYRAVRTDSVINRMDLAIDNLSNSIDVQVSDAMVEAAVNKAVDKAAKDKVAAVTNSALNIRRSEIEAQVGDAVKASLGEISRDVKETAEKKIRNLDLSEIKKEVLSDVREKAEEKLKNDMDDILEDYKSHLRNIDSVYESIAETLADRGSKGTILKL